MAFLHYHIIIFRSVIFASISSMDPITSFLNWAAELVKRSFILPVCINGFLHPTTHLAHCAEIYFKP